MPGTTSSGADNCIYLVEVTREYDGMNGWYRETHVSEDYGYFTDKAKAEAFVKNLNDSDYANQVESAEKSYEEAKALNRRKQDEYDALVKAGIKPVHWRPVDIYPYKAPQRVDWYGVLEVEPA